MEIGIPTLRNWYMKKKKTFESAETRYEKDFHLPGFAALGLLSEYIEMVLQFGFVVMFGAIFPLAPLFALFNNILEIRVDAYKLVSVRRILPLRAKDIGNWARVLEFIAKLGMIHIA